MLTLLEDRTQGVLSTSIMETTGNLVFNNARCYNEIGTNMKEGLLNDFKECKALWPKR